jgi:hypothetical protein
LTPTDELLSARREQLEVCKIAVHDGEIFDTLFVEIYGDVGAVGHELRNLAADLHGLSNSAQFKKGLEGGSFNVNGVGIRKKVSHRVVATLVGCGFLGGTFGSRGNRNFGASNGVTLRVVDCADNAARSPAPSLRSQQTINQEMTPIVLKCGDQPPLLSLHPQVSFYARSRTYACKTNHHPACPERFSTKGAKRGISRPPR